MADSVAETAASVAETAHPVEVLRDALETRITRHDEEIALVERQYRQLSKRIEEAKI